MKQTTEGQSQSHDSGKRDTAWQTAVDFEASFQGNRKRTTGIFSLFVGLLLLAGMIWGGYYAWNHDLEWGTLCERDAVATELQKGPEGWNLVVLSDMKTACALPGTFNKDDYRPVEDLDLAPKSRLIVPVEKRLVSKWQKRLRRATEKGKKEDPVVANRLKELENKLANVNKSFPAKDNKTDHGRRSAINYIEVKINALKEKLYLPTPALGYPWVIIQGTQGLFSRKFTPKNVHMAPRDPWPLESISNDEVAEGSNNSKQVQQGG